MELQWLLQIQEHLTSPAGDTLMIGLSTLGDKGFLWIAIACVLLLVPRWRPAGGAMLLALLCAHVLGNLILKEWVARPRPFVAYPSLPLKLPPLQEYSFPSGHTITAFAAVFSLPPGLGRLKRTLLVLATAIAVSRLYLFMHYPTDVLGGMGLGIAVGFGVSRLPWTKLKKCG